MTAASWGGLIALVAIALSTVALVAVHVMPTGVRPLPDPVSQYQHTRARGWITASTLLSGVACVGAVVALIALLGSAGAVAAVLVGISAAARFLLPLIRMDAPGTATTSRGRIHTVLAFVMFGALTAAAFVAGGALHDAGFAGAATWSTVFGVVMAIGAVGDLVIALRGRGGLFGFFERVIYVGMIAWLVLIGSAALVS